MNDNLITNLPNNCSVEVPCYVDRSGIQPTIVGDLPEQLAALNRTNINPQILTVEAAITALRMAQMKDVWWYPIQFLAKKVNILYFIKRTQSEFLAMSLMN